MIDYPDARWTQPQLMECLNRIAHLLQSKVFKPSMPFTQQSQLRWIELIRAVSDLVRQSALLGRRINFTDEVSAQGDDQDITSLLDTMRQSAHVVGAITPAQQNLQFVLPTLNYVNGARWVILPMVCSLPVPTKTNEFFSLVGTVFTSTGI